MNSPLAALLWQEWRKNGRWILLGFVLTVLGTCSLVAVDQTSIWRDIFIGDTAADISGVFTFFFIILAGGVLLLSYNSGNRNDVQLGFPPHLYTLPIATTPLALFRSVYTLVTMAAVTGGMALFRLFVFEETNFSGETMLPIVIVAYFQAFWWFLSGLMGGWAVIASLVLIVLIVPIFASVSTLLNFYSDNPMEASIGFILVSVIIAVIGVHLDRRGAWHGIKTWFARSQISRTATKAPFKGPAEAQYWYERRRIGYILSTVFVMGVVGFFALYVLIIGPQKAGPELRADIVYDDSSLALLVFLLIFATVTGSVWMFVREIGEHNSGISRFVLMRPMDTHEIAQARLRASTFSATLLTALAGVLVFSVGLLPENIRDLLEAPFISVLCAMSACAILLWAVQGLAVYVIAVVVAVYVVFLVIGGFVLSLPRSASKWLESIVDVESVLYGLVALGIVGCCIFLFWKARQCRVLIAHAAIRAGGLFVLSAALIVVAFFHVLDSTTLPDRLTFFIALASLPALPIMPLAIVPLTIHFFRHR